MPLQDEISRKLCSVIDDAKNDLHRRLHDSMPEIGKMIVEHTDRYLQHQFFHELNKMVGGPALVLSLPENLSYQTFGHLVHWQGYDGKIAKLSPLAENEVLAFLENRYKELRESPTQYNYHRSTHAGRCKVCDATVQMICDHTNLDAASFTICFGCKNIICLNNGGSTVDVAKD